jgi:hypothetical protein
MKRLTLFAVSLVALSALAGSASADRGLSTRTYVQHVGTMTVTTTLTYEQVPAAQAPKPYTIACFNNYVVKVGWEQNMHDYSWGLFWTNQQSGSYYYGCGGYHNGTKYSPSVWQASQFGWDNGGWHRCDTGGHQIGVTITGLGCWKAGDPSQYPNLLKEFDQFKISAFFQGFPVSKTITACAGFDPYGNMYVC